MENTDRDNFILENMGLVHFVVDKYVHRTQGCPSIDREDLVSEGTIGLIKACDRFDPKYGTKFSTYAVYAIRGEVARFLRDKTDLIGFTRQAKSDYLEILEADLIKEDISTISNILGMTREDVKNALAYYRHRHTDSLDKEIYSDEGSSFSLVEKTGVEVDMDTGLEIELSLSKLDKRTRKIVELRLQDLTQREIGEIVGISQVEICRQLKKAREKLKEFNKEVA